jgi:glycosyltransferase involved in cell wall biosynthesis
MPVHIFTSATANYIPKARVLAQSVKRHHPQFRFHLVFPDAVPGGFRLEDEPFDALLTVADLGIENPEQWVFKHNLVELSTAVKGPALAKLLSLPDCSAVIYFDPDVVVLAPLDRLIEEFRSASILLTPHLTEPETTLEAIRDNEISALQHGIYNLGFLGVKNCEEGRRFARWWADRLCAFCYDDIPKGLFTDQRWADLVPAYFPGCRVLRDPAYNVCTWNLSHRMVEGRLPDGLSVSGRPIVFYHFSGFDSGAQQAMLDKYGARMRGLYQLRKWYVAECDRMGQQEYSTIPWRYGWFDNGEPVTEEHRRLYRERVDLQQAFPNPFSTSDPNHSYYHWYEANYEIEASRAGLPARRTTAPGPAPRRPFLRGLSGTRPAYRIFLAVAEADRERAPAAARELLEKSHQKSALYVVGPERALADVFADAALRGSLTPLPLPPGAGHDEAFSEILGQFHDRDFLFVKASTIVPEHWDLRLAWSTVGQQGVATVSPLCDQQGFTGIGPSGAAASAGTSASGVELLDRVCYHCSQAESPELPQFLEDCFYVCADAARHSLLLCRKLGPASSVGLSAFLELTRKLRYSHVLAEHVYVGSVAPRQATGSPDSAGDAWAAPCPALSEWRRRAHGLLAARAASSLPAIALKMLPRHLHVMHSWGGGLERWVRDYCRADHAHHNLVLKSVGAWGAFGQELHLYRHIDDAAPVKIWPLYPAIKGTTAAHSGYEEAFSEIIDRYGIERVLVSSLVGHSLEALRAEPPTVLICHDYCPFCPALNITFKGVCRQCTEEDLTHCTVGNPHHRFFRNIPPSHWLRLRQEFARRVKQNQITMIAPAPSVGDNYVRLLPDLAGCFRVIPHGTWPIASGPLALEPEGRGRLRVLILGSLAPHKGLALFQQIKDRLVEFAEVFLIGCGSYGEGFAGPGITVLPEYEWAQLPKILAEIRPDVGLLLSVVPETFSYTLQELFDLGVPPLATRIGSLQDRIEHGVNGFLCEPDPSDVLRSLRELAEDRAALSRVHARLCRRPARTVPEMLADYRELLASEAPSASAYFCPDARQTAEQRRAAACSQLYWRAAGGAFDEASSVSAWFALTHRPQRLRLRVPSLEHPPAELRLDVASQPGFMLVKGLRLYGADRRCIWSWDGAPESLGASQHSELVIVGRAGGEGVLLALTGEDPHLILPVEAAVLAELRRGGTLEFEFCWPGREQCVSLLVASLLRGNGSELSGAQLEALVRQLTAEASEEDSAAVSRAVHLERLARQLSQAQLRIAELENSWSWRLSRPLRLAGGIALKFMRRRPV